MFGPQIGITPLVGLTHLSHQIFINISLFSTKLSEKNSKHILQYSRFENDLNMNPYWSSNWRNVPMFTQPWQKQTVKVEEKSQIWTFLKFGKNLIRAWSCRMHIKVQNRDTIQANFQCSVKAAYNDHLELRRLTITFRNNNIMLRLNYWNLYSVFENGTFIFYLKSAIFSKKHSYIFSC